MKQHNKVARLDARVQDYEKTVHDLKDSRGYHKPGSVKKTGAGSYRERRTK